VLWCIYAIDDPAAAERRVSARAAHSAHLKEAPLPVVLKGPLVADDGKTPAGSLIVVEAATRGDVEDFVKSDPFCAAAIWKEVRVTAFVRSESQ
jgi:uncharacterized protein